MRGRRKAWASHCERKAWEKQELRKEGINQWLKHEPCRVQAAMTGAEKEAGAFVLGMALSMCI